MKDSDRRSQGSSLAVLSTLMPFRLEPVAPGAIGRLVRVRMRRQQVLQRDGLRIEVVLD
jgi:hypothetical protein